MPELPSPRGDSIQNQAADLCLGLTTLPPDLKEISEGLYLASAQLLTIDMFAVLQFHKAYLSPLFMVFEGRQMLNQAMPLDKARGLFLDQLLAQRAPLQLQLSPAGFLAESQVEIPESFSPCQAAVLPMFHAEKLWGAAVILTRQSEAEIEVLLGTLAVLATVASGQFTTALSIQREQESVVKLSILENLLSILTAPSPLPERLQWAVEFTAEMMSPVEVCIFHQLESKLAAAAATEGFSSPGSEADWDVELANQAFISGETLILEKPEKNRFQYSTPLWEDGKASGILELRRTASAGFTSMELDLLPLVEMVLSAALSDSRLLMRYQRQEWITTVLSEAARSAARPGDTYDALLSVLQLLILLAGVEWAVLYLVSPSGEAVPGPAAGLTKSVRTDYERSAWRIEELLDAEGQEKNRLFVFTLPQSLQAIFGTASCSAIVFHEENIPLGVLLFPHSSDVFERADLFEGIGFQIQLRLSNARLVEKTAAQREMEREIQLARRIQESFLPEHMPSYTGWDISCSWMAAHQVGGDFYDFIESAAGKGNKPGFWFTVADVSGKGMPAALYMALSRTLLRASIPGESTPGEILTRINYTLLHDTAADHFISLFLGFWSAEGSCLHYANAGHNPPLLALPDGSCTVLEEHGMVLGIQENLPYETFTVKVPPDAMIVLYTDGITEAESSAGHFYGIKRLVQQISHLIPWSSTAAVDRIIDDSDRFSSGSLSDDRTLVVLHRLHDTN